MILLIEDNLSIIEGLQFSFEKNNYTLDFCTCVKQASDYLSSHSPELIILDISLPDGNGFGLYERIIKAKGIPTIFLTAKDNELDVVKGLELGAEDYITKPFSTKELLARVKKIIARNKKSTIINVKDISYDIDRMSVYRNGCEISLTSLERNILNLLFMNIDKVVRRGTLIDLIWESTGNDVDDHTVTVYLKRIREKLKTDIIKTIKGIGYRIDHE